jgi:hypothetical protein
MSTKSVPGLIGICFLAGLLFVSCSRHNTPADSSPELKNKSVSVPSPPCIIYRTRLDYSRNVPVILSEDRTKIVSYPDIKDIYYNGRLSVPTVLANGFLLDNRGISKQVAFLQYTYEEYSKLPSTPRVADLMSRILDKDPLLEMYQCGQRSQYTDIEKELNDLITSGKLSTCKKLK